MKKIFWIFLFLFYFAAYPAACCGDEGGSRTLRSSNTQRSEVFERSRVGYSASKNEPPRSLLQGGSFLFGAANIQALEVTSPFPTIENKNVGKAVPNFKLTVISGEETDLESVRAGRKMILFFWATWCPSCRETLKEFEAKTKEFERKNIKLVLVNVGEKQKFVKKFLEKNKIQLDTFLDEQSSLAELYELNGVPAFRERSSDRYPP